MKTKIETRGHYGSEEMTRAEPSERKPAGRTIQSVERALLLLEQVASQPEGLTLSDMAERTGLNSSTCHHLVSTLVSCGYLTHLSRSRGYALGSKIRELSELAERETDPSVLLRDDLMALGQRLGRGVQFAVLSGTSLITKLSIPHPDSRVQEPDEIEKMTALHATATGKSILAWIPDTELVRVISANGLSGYTQRTITTLSGLMEELRLVRRRKYSVDDEEFRNGVVCIGTTLREGGGAVVGAISATLPASEATDEHRKAVISEMIAASNDFSRKLQNARR